jgi:hypothetical protein
MFRTELTPAVLPRLIALHHPILTVGSCFADTIGQQLGASKFNVLSNPFGTVYNPLSIHLLLLHSATNTPPRDDGYLQREDVALHFDFHSRFAALSRSALAQQITNVINTAHRFLHHARWLLITYGTAWIYRLKETHRLVANCHKIPASIFTKELLTEKQILDSFDELHQTLSIMNPHLQIILTVSPVRHLRDTLELNSVSKSVLRLACHTLSQQYANVHYFPAYELLLDDLRDYRFYHSDLLHPSAEAVQYIWDKFIQAAVDDSTRQFIQEWAAIRQALEHKPLVPNSRAHIQFVEATLNRLQKLSTLVDVSNEMEALKKQLPL